MRCKNCGWDNPDGSVKCEKCNAPISSYMVDNKPERSYQPEAFNPQATVANVNFSSMGHTPAGESNLKATAIGCSACGYPVRPTDTECPVCGQAFSGQIEAPKAEPVAEKKFAAGTVIQGATSDKDYGNKERKKLTGFLVTYSHSPNGDFFPLFEGKNAIGRSPSLPVCIQGDPNVSEKHLSILYRTIDRKFKFKDEQSSNGTFVNGQLIDEGELKNSDEIRIGATRLTFIEIPQTAFE